MPARRLACFWTHPALVWAVVLATVFIAEAAVMLLLPWVMPRDDSWLAQEALVDIRRMSLGQRPSLLDNLGLAPALDTPGKGTRILVCIPIEKPTHALEEAVQPSGDYVL